MKPITKNFRLNALANSYSAGIYDHVCKLNGGPHFQIVANGSPITIQIAGGVSGVRQLVDEFYLNALKKNYQGWEAMGLALMAKCLNKNNSVTAAGLGIWESMVNDMGDSLAETAR